MFLRSCAARFRPYTTKVAFGGAALGTCFVLANQKKLFATSDNENIAISPDEFRELRLNSVTYYNHNTNIFRLGFPSKDQSSGLTTASFILVKGSDKEGKVAVRPYTPISSNSTKGHLDLLIKKYPEGNVSKYVHDLKVGDFVEVKGPFKKLEYSANMKKEIGMVAGGTGITPMVQVLEEIFNNPADRTKVSMIFANISEEDILCKELLDSLAHSFPNRFKVYYTLDKPHDEWNGGVGFVTADMAREHLPAPSKDSLILFCGPPPMLKAVAGEKGPNYTQGEVGGVLKELGFETDMVYKF